MTRVALPCLVVICCIVPILGDLRLIPRASAHLDDDVDINVPWASSGQAAGYRDASSIPQNAAAASSGSSLRSTARTQPYRRLHSAHALASAHAASETHDLRPAHLVESLRDAGGDAALPWGLRHGHSGAQAAEPEASRLRPKDVLLVVPAMLERLLLVRAHRAYTQRLGIATVVVLNATEEQLAGLNEEGAQRERERCAPLQRPCLAHSHAAATHPGKRPTRTDATPAMCARVHEEEEAAGRAVSHARMRHDRRRLLHVHVLPRRPRVPRDLPPLAGQRGQHQPHARRRARGAGALHRARRGAVGQLQGALLRARAWMRAPASQIETQRTCSSAFAGPTCVKR